MKIAISSSGKNLEAQVAPRFGRCPYFMIFDTDTMGFETISNESAMTFGGAGVQAAQIVAKAGVKVVITGNVGPNAYQTLKAAGIRVFTEASGTIKDAVALYKKDKLQEINAPNVESHFGKGGKI